MTDDRTAAVLIGRIEGPKASWAYVDYNRDTMRAVSLRVLNETAGPLVVEIKVEGEEPMQFTCPAGDALDQPLDFPIGDMKRGVTGFSAVLRQE